jgi:hypothetical protein
MTYVQFKGEGKAPSLSFGNDGQGIIVLDAEFTKCETQVTDKDMKGQVNVTGHIWIDEN